MHKDLLWEQLITLNLFEMQKGLNTDGSGEEHHCCRSVVWRGEGLLVSQLALTSSFPLGQNGFKPF